MEFETNEQQIRAKALELAIKYTEIRGSNQSTLEIAKVFEDYINGRD